MIWFTIGRRIGPQTAFASLEVQTSASLPDDQQQTEKVTCVVKHMVFAKNNVR